MLKKPSSSPETKSDIQNAASAIGDALRITEPPTFVRGVKTQADEPSQTVPGDVPWYRRLRYAGRIGFDEKREKRSELQSTFSTREVTSSRKRSRAKSKR